MQSMSIKWLISINVDARVEPAAATSRSSECGATWPTIALLQEMTHSHFDDRRHPPSLIGAANKNSTRPAMYRYTDSSIFTRRVIDSVEMHVRRPTRSRTVLPAD